MRNFRNYEIWKLAIELGTSIYQLSALLPDDERFGFKSQLKRAVVSISSNIAEGCSRSSEKEFKRFIEISLGSAFEIESQLILAQKIGLLEEKQLESTYSEIQLLQKKLNALRSKLNY